MSTLKLKRCLCLCGVGLLFSLSACASHAPKETVAPNATTPDTAVVVQKAVVKTKVAKKKININTADVKTLRTIKGIGSKRAAAILNYRTKHGSFQSVKDLMKLKGKGYSFSKNYVNSIKHLVTV